MAASKAATITAVEYLAWLHKHAPAALTQSLTRPPATPDELAALARALGVALPAQVAEVFAAANGGLPLAEYDSLSTSDIVEFHLASAASGKQSFKQCRWLPLAADGGGNCFIVDLSEPAPQVRLWEIHGRVASKGVPLAMFLQTLFTAVVKQKIRFADGSWDRPHPDPLVKLFD